MLEFYRLPEFIRVTASVLAVASVVTLSAGAFYSAVRRRSLEALLLALMTLHAVLLIYLIAQVQLGAGDGFIVSSGVRALRYASFAATAVIAAAVALGRKAASPLLAILPALITLPISETVSGSLFPMSFCLALLIDIAFSATVIAAARREISTSLSAASVKQAIDALHTGIMFCEPSGYILLINRRMLSLMQTLTGETMRDGKKFYERLCAGECKHGCAGLRLDDNAAYRLPDSSVWMFSFAPVSSGGREYIQLTASDVSERWRMTEELEAQQIALLARSGELRDATENIHELCREEEALRMKSRFHDVLGHRVALLLRALRENKEPDETLLSDLSLEVESEPAGGAAAESKKRIDTLQSALLGVGVELSITGELPEDAGLSSLAADIITEGSTNAVRHGFPSRVDVLLESSSGAFSVTITNNGTPPKGEIREGGGLLGMRRRLQALGGSLATAASPRFVLTARVPTGDNL